MEWNKERGGGREKRGTLAIREAALSSMARCSRSRRRRRLYSKMSYSFVYLAAVTISWRTGTTVFWLDNRTRTEEREGKGTRNPLSLLQIIQGTLTLPLPWLTRHNFSFFFLLLIKYLSMGFTSGNTLNNDGKKHRNEIKLLWNWKIVFIKVLSDESGHKRMIIKLKIFNL